MIEPKETLKNINPYRVEPYAQPCVMKLDANENYLGPSPKVMKRLENLSIKEVSHYPCYGELIDILASVNKVSKENIAVTNGADEALCSIINTYLSKDDTMITVSPSFSMPEIYANVIGAEYKVVEYKEKWSFPQEEFLSAIDEKVKIILLTTPNNPTGDIIPPEYIEKILKLHPQKLIIVDETYSSYAGCSCKNLIDLYDNLAVVRSMSKDYGLAGLRIGYVLSSKENIKNLKKLLSPYSVNNIAVIAAKEALCDKKYLEFLKEEISRSKEYLKNELTRLGAVVYPSYANFLLVDFKDKAQSIYEKLAKNGIVVKKYNGGVLENHLRITVPSLNASKKMIQILSPENLFVFDMDGVLIGVSNSYRKAIALTYEHFCGKEISFSKIQEAKNLGGLNNDWDLTSFLISSEGIAVPYEKVVEKFQEIYWNDGKGAINDEELLISPEMLESLNGVKVIFTGRLRSEALFTLEKFGIEKYFSMMVTMDDLPKNRLKPDTLGLEMIKKETAAKNIFYMGDTVDDMKCAKDFNITGIGVLAPEDKSDGQKDLLYVSGAKYVINNINELPQALEKLNENR